MNDFNISGALSTEEFRTFLNQFPKCLETFEVTSELVTGFKYPVPTLLSSCPKCGNKVKWRTTGIYPLYLECNVCNQKFTIN